MKKRNDTISKRRKVCYICKKGFGTDDDNKKCHTVRDYCHYTGKYREAAHNIYNLTYKTPKEIPVVIHNDYTCDFIIKNLAEEFDGPFECLGEIQKNILLFQYQLKKNPIMITQLHTS